MTTPKELKSTFRYFLARLKPFARPIFLVPLGATLVLGLVIWQYFGHPELSEQPSETENPTGNNIDTVDIIPTDTETNKGIDQIPLPQASPKASPGVNSKLGSNIQPDFFSHPTQPRNEQNQPQGISPKASTTQLFRPLFPPPAPDNSSVIAPGNVTGGNLPNSQVTIEEDNPLQKALERQFPNSYSTSTTGQSSSPNRNYQSDINQPQNNNNYTGQAVPTQPSNQYYQTPYNTYGGQVTQPQNQIQSYPPAYNSYNNPYNGQVPDQSAQSPDNNTYGGQPNPGYPNQVPPNGNPYGTVTPQIQPSLEGNNY